MLQPVTEAPGTPGSRSSLDCGDIPDLHNVFSTTSKRWLLRGQDGGRTERHAVVRLAYLNSRPGRRLCDAHLPEVLRHVRPRLMLMVS